ncbi:uncharacterized protein LOC129573396 [Sitodiplosis mosellana]|uniref:uncharacterized protein LOC129573396 n=1 Tax=Sitodiplosis mosellana TaxID=263140 RepID=UPI0024440E33|nr:uncharacterized protein LOC129573396 [Sitodiplosis mosellana]
MDIFKSKRCFDWKVTGIGVSVVSIALTLGLAAYFGLFILKRDVVVFFVGVSMLILNLTVSISWLFAIYKKKPGLMLVSLFWWAVPLSLWIGFVFFVLFKGVSDYFKYKSSHFHRDQGIIYPVTVFFIAFYFAAVLSYNNMKEAIKKSRSEIPRLDVSYSVTATECKDVINLRIEE